jgi:hypothetical protein
MACVTQAPRDGEPSVTFATNAAQNSATKRLNPISSRQFQFIAGSINLPPNSHKTKMFQAGNQVPAALNFCPVS